jgi:hypothetical protein
MWRNAVLIVVFGKCWYAVLRGVGRAGHAVYYVFYDCVLNRCRASSGFVDIVMLIAP